MDGMELCYICGLLGELELYRDDAFDEPIPTIYKPGSLYIYKSSFYLSFRGRFLWIV